MASRLLGLILLMYGGQPLTTPLLIKPNVVIVFGTPVGDRHRRSPDDIDPTNKTIDSLTHLELPAGVGIELKM